MSEATCPIDGEPTLREILAELASGATIRCDEDGYELRRPGKPIGSHTLMHHLISEGWVQGNANGGGYVLTDAGRLAYIQSTDELGDGELRAPKDGVDVPVPPSGEAEYQSWLPVGKHAPEKVYYMRDNHTFRALPLDVKGACEAIREEFADGESYGMLCTKRPGAAAPLHAGKELAEFLPRAREWLVAEFAARGVNPSDGGKAG